MNQNSEQITLDKSLIIAQDQPLSSEKLQECLIEILGSNRCRIIKIPVAKWAVEYKEEGKTYHILAKACTYLGNPHPVFKKRVQIPKWYKEYVAGLRDSQPDIDVRFIGIYHYGDAFHGDNIILIDFEKDTYLRHTLNNSSAHVYTNDLFQAMNYGVFRKEDKSGNRIAAVRRDRFKDYLLGKGVRRTTLFDLFRDFNNGFSFGKWLKAMDVIREMHQGGWHQWRQGEWPGWFLEYRFNEFTVKNRVTDRMRYVGSSMKRAGDLDFDIRFEDEDFYGDLKASDIGRKESPGNDQENLIECIWGYEKFWYVIYEHETIKDSDSGYEATRDRNRYIRSVDPAYDKDDMSYGRRMKNSVKFVRMTIIELNRVNFREVLTSFNQGHQPDGSSRKPKFMINKAVMNNDNYVVFRYTYGENG